MTGVAAVWVALVLAVVVVGALAPKRSRKAIGGLMGKDKRGRTTLVIWPATGKRKGRKR